MFAGLHSNESGANEIGFNGSGANERGSLRAPWIAGLLMALPVVVAPYPPMTDLAHHEGLVALLHSMSDAARFPQGMYFQNWGHPNQLFHLLAWPLSYVVSITLACKLVAAGSVLAVPVAAARLARHLGGSSWLGLLACPVALGWLFTWGFVNNLMGFSALLALLPTLDRFTESPSARKLWQPIAAMLLLYLAHELMMFVFLAAAVWFALVRPKTWRGRMIALIPVILDIALAAGQVVYQRRFRTGTTSHVPLVIHGLGKKLLTIPLNFDGPRDVAELLMFATFCVTVGIIAWQQRRSRAGWRSHAGERDPLRTSDASRLLRLGDAYRFELLATLCLLLYLALPLTLLGAIFVYNRFLAPGLVIGALCLTRGPQRLSLLGRTLCVILPIELMLVMWPMFYDSSQNVHDVETLLRKIPAPSAVANLDLDHRGPRAFNVATAASLFFVHSGGRLLYSFTEATVSPAVIRPELQWNEPAMRIMPDSLELVPAHDLTRFRYVLVHSREPLPMQVCVEALRGFARLVAFEGEWTLLESTLPVVPVDSPDVALPEPSPPSLGVLMQEIADRIVRSRRKQGISGNEARVDPFREPRPKERL